MGLLLLENLTNHCKDKVDTINYLKESHSENLVKNGQFETFYYKPITIENNGYSPAEELIVDWMSPDNGTPDYYSEIRLVKDVPDHISPSAKLTDNTGYMGMILYHDPSNRHLLYSEHLQTRLKERLVKGKTYCVKLDILLSLNAGYYIDQFGALLTPNPVKSSENEFECIDQNIIKYTKVLNNREHWIRLCSSYISNGTEKYLTIGNFQKEGEINKIAIRPYQKSSLDINESAYYLIDNVELIPVSSPMKYECGEIVIPSLGRRKIIQTFDELEPTNLVIGDEIILDNVQFEFNQFEILESATEELNYRVTHINDNYLYIS